MSKEPIHYKGFHLAKRRRTIPSPYVISGETITATEAATRLGIKTSAFDSRRRAALEKLKPGEKLTWEMLER